MASQRTQRSQKVPEEHEIERLSCDVIKYLLILDQKKVPIKKADINKNILKENSKAFPIVIDEVRKRLKNVFGIALKEMEGKHSGSFILVNKVTQDLEESHIQWPEADDSKHGLLMVVLTLIFMNGNTITDHNLWSSLKKFGIDQDQPHPVFGEIQKLICQEWVRQCYLDIVKQPNTDPPLSEVKWGQRACLEISKRSVLEFVSKVYEMDDLSQWTSQWKDIQQTEGGQGDQPSTSAVPALTTRSTRS